LRKGIVGLLLCLSCLGSSVWAQSAAPKDQLFHPMTPPAGLLGPGPSVSDAKMPVPEGGVLADRTYRNRYFGFSYGLPPGWEESLEGPPPSDAGYYVLGQFRQMDTSRKTIKGTILITASDMFFSRPVGSAKELIESMKATLNRFTKSRPYPPPSNLAIILLPLRLPSAGCGVALEDSSHRDTLPHCGICLYQPRHPIA